MKGSTMNNPDVEMKPLKCSWCGAIIEPEWQDYDVINPGGKTVIAIRLCDDCWKKYKEAKNANGIHQ